MLKIDIKSAIGEIVTQDKKEKEIIDDLLALSADLWCNMGKSSTQSEIDETRKNARFIYRAIKNFDREMGDLFLRVQDKKIDGKED